MKIIYTAFLIFVAINFSFTQNWKPINPAEKFNYTLDGNTVYSTIWSDSSKIIEGDSVFFLNKIVLPCEDCWQSEAVLMNQPSFLLSAITLFNDGSYKLSKQDSILFIKPFAGLNEPWIFDTINNITAEIISLNDTLIFGQQDSIKTIALSDENEIIISKQHGIIKFPLFNVQKEYVKLYGIEGRNLGFVTPYFEDFFSFGVGDTFEYFITSEGYPWITEHIKQYTITEKQVEGDSVIFIINSRGIKYYSPPPRWDTSWYSNVVDTLIYVNSSDHFLNANIHQLVGFPGQEWNPDGCGWSYLKYQYLVDPILLVKNKGSMNLKVYSGDTLINDHDYYACPEVKSYSYAEKIGLIRYYYAEPDFVHTYSREEELNGSIVDGQLYGTLTADSLFLSTEVRPDMISKVGIFPNPFTDFIRIDLKDHDYFNIRVCNLSGNEIFRQNNIKNKDVINLSFLASGIYFIEVSSTNVIAHRKIVKVK